MPLAPKPIPDALHALYGAQDLLGKHFPDHKFTIDGKIIGDIGEAIAIAVFGLEKLRPNTANHDLQTQDGRLVQVKATQKQPAFRGVGLGLVKTQFEYLLVIEFDRVGVYEILYNGPGSFIDKAREHKASASLSRKQLRECQTRVDPKLRLQLASR